MEAPNATILLIDVDPFLSQALKALLADPRIRFANHSGDEAHLVGAKLSACALVLSAGVQQSLATVPVFVDSALRDGADNEQALARALSICQIALDSFYQLQRIQSLKAELQALVQEQRVACAREKLVADVSHDLRTPLNGLILDAQLRRLQLDKGNFEAFSAGRLAELFKRDEQQLLEMARLVEQMLDGN